MTSIAPVSSRRAWDLLRLALGAAVLTSVWRLQDLFSALAPFRLPTLMLLLVAGVLVISPREHLRLALASREFVMRGLFVLVFLAVLSIPTSLYVGHSLTFFVKELTPALLLALATAAAIYTVADARRVAALQLAGAAVYAIVILTRYEIGEGGRLGSLVYYDANDLGMLLVCMLPIAIFYIGFGARLAERALALSVAVMFLLTIVRTGSRGAFLGLVAVVLYLLFRYSAVHWGRRVAIVLFGAALFVGLTGSQYWTTIGTILEPTADYNWSGQSDGGRMEVWERGVNYMKGRPLTGVGLAAFPIAEGTISPLASRQMFGRGVRWSAAHSSYVQIGAELGVLALLVFVATLLGALVLCGRLARDASRRGERGVAALAHAQGAGLIGYMVAGAFLSQAYAPFLFVAFGAIVGLDVAARQSWREAAVAR